jgi:hypothetical protein
MKQLSLISYEYPNLIKVKVGGVDYTYYSSHFWCQKFLSAYTQGGRFNSLNWFKRVSKVVRKETKGNEN